MPQYLIQYVFVEVGHVAMVRHRPVVIVLEVLLQGHGVVWDVQHRVQVMRKHLKNRHACTGAQFALRGFHPGFFTRTQTAGFSACQDSFLLFPLDSSLLRGPQ